MECFGINIPIMVSVLSEEFFLSYQAKLEDEADWLSVLEPRASVLWRNRAWRDFLGLPAISSWAEAALLVETSHVRVLDDAISRALKESIITCKILPLRVRPWEAVPFAVSVGKLHCEQDEHCALVMLHCLKL